MIRFFSIAIACLLLLSGCGGGGAHKPQSSIPFAQQQDAEPSAKADPKTTPDAIPRPEPRTRAGNFSPYKVLGKTYRVMDSSENYKVDGLASWYGTKFHGRPTANGELYDLYAMTAAHKTLPIPTYLWVTNLNNNRKVIVRVNDRGPFHSDRVIDLSYAAAVRLGFDQLGTAPVRIEAIDPAAYQQQNEGPKLRPQTIQLKADSFLQVGAYGQYLSAERLQAELTVLLDEPVLITTDEELHRVRIGPIENHRQLQKVRDLLAHHGHQGAHLVYPDEE